MSYSNIEDGGAGLSGTAGSSATDLGSGEKESLSFIQRVRNTIPETVNLDILDLTSSQPMSERFYLLTKYMQPWSEFFNISEFNIPVMSEYKARIQANIGAFFYNYFIIGCVFDVVYLILNFISVLILLACCGIAFFLYTQSPEDIENETISNVLKYAKFPVIIICCVLAVTKGALFTLVLSALFFFVAVVGIHASIREHEA